MNGRMYGRQFNNDIVKELAKIKEEIEKEKEVETPNKSKLTEMEMNYLLKGMELQTNIYNNNFGKHIPW